MVAFFARPATDVAPALLGSTVAGGGVVVELTEVEAYAGAADPASHAYRGPTPRARVMFGPPGRVYVYLSYGMHHCVNLVCERDGIASAVLLRAGRVVGGEAAARRRRGDTVAADALARGPGNLAKALGIDLDATGTTLWDGPLRWHRRRPDPAREAGEIRSGPRVGVSEASEVDWRFWLDADPTVSVYRRSPRAPLVPPAE